MKQSTPSPAWSATDDLLLVAGGTLVLLSIADIIVTQISPENSFGFYSLPIQAIAFFCVLKGLAACGKPSLDSPAWRRRALIAGIALGMFGVDFLLAFVFKG